MSAHEQERLLSDLRRDPGQIEELRKLGHDAGAVARWVSERGYNLARPEIEALLATDRELSDEDLEQAAGGNDPWTGAPPDSGSGG